ncbi:MAG: hypothetical protein ACOZIN_04460 [Myxococcota bacterium]
MERLEAIEHQMREASAQLRSPKWRTELFKVPYAVDAIVRSAAALEADLERARKLQAQDPSEDLLTLLKRVEQARLDLLASARKRTGPKPPNSLEPLMRDVQRRAHAELPRPLDPGEHVVMSGGFTRQWWKASLAYGAGFGLMPVLTGFALELGAGVANAAWLAAVPGLLAAFATSVLFRREAGRYVLTTRRLIHEPRRADPVDVPLSAIPPGAVRVTGLPGTLELDTPRRLRLVAADQAQELATAIELERWLLNQDAAPPGAPPRWRAHVLPQGGESAIVTAYLLLTHESFVVFPIASNDIRYRLAGVLGAVPRVPVTLERLCRAMERLDSSRANRVIEELARALGVTVRRDRRVLRRRLWANFFGFEQDGKIFWFYPASYDSVTALSGFVAGWEHVLVPDEPTFR